MGKISRFGLLELSRQRLQPSLGETSHVVCPRCNGTGHMRGTESTALHILRIIQEEAMKESTAAIHAQIPVDVATFLLNEKRADIWKIEARFKVSVVLIPNLRLETPHYTINRLKTDEVAEIDKPSYELASLPEETSVPEKVAADAAKPRQIAVVRDITPPTSAPMRAPIAPAQEPSMLGKISSWFAGLFAEEKVEVAPTPKRPARPERDRGPRSRNQRDRQGRGGQPRADGAQQRPPRPEQAKPTLAERPTDAAPAAQAENNDRPKRNRSRGGRNRGERPERTDPQQQTLAEPTSALETEVVVAAAPRPDRPERGERPDRQQGRNRGRGERPPREAAAASLSGEANGNRLDTPQESIVVAAQNTMEAAEPAFIPNEVFAPVPVSQANQAELAFVASEPAPAPAPVKEPPVQEPPVKEPPAKAPEETVPTPTPIPSPIPQPIPPPKPVDLNAVGLVMIETSGDKIAAAPIIEEPVAPRGPRPKPAWAQKSSGSNEPMQQVETRDA